MFSDLSLYISTIWRPYPSSAVYSRSEVDLLAKNRTVNYESCWPVTDSMLVRIEIHWVSNYDDIQGRVSLRKAASTIITIQVYVLAGKTKETESGFIDKSGHSLRRGYSYGTWRFNHVNWGIPSSDGIPLRGCRLFFFFFFSVFPPFLVFQWPTQREGNTGFRWYFVETCLLTLFTCCYKIFHMQSYFTELWVYFE